MQSLKVIFALIVLLCPVLSEAEPLKIGTKVTPPFVIKEGDQYSGISIELFKHAADELGLEYEFVESDLEGLVAGLQDGTLDASVAALTVTASREAVIDFSHPYFTTGIAIAARAEPNGLMGSFKKLFSLRFLYAIAGLGALLMAVGAVVWLFERKHNQDQFGGSVVQGLGSGFWWAAVTMTTVGYGDKSPTTFLGRIVGLIWMFAAIILISGFTAAIATSLTVNSLDAKVGGLDDLNSVKVLAVANSASADFLDEERIRFATAQSVESAMAALASGKTDAVVYDAPLLKYITNTHYSDSVTVLPGVYLRQDYAVALPSGSALREPLNQVFLKYVSSAEWADFVSEFLGQE